MNSPAIRDVPDAEGLFFTRRREPLSVRRKRKPGDVTVVPLKLTLLRLFARRAGLETPQAQRLVTSDGELFSVGGKRQRLYVSGFEGKLVENAILRRVDHANGFIG